MKNSVRRGLFHPDDIKTIGLANPPPGPLSAPLPTLSRKSSRSTLSPLGLPSPSTLGPSSTHSRSASLAASVGNGGSFGRAEAKKLPNQAEFGKYTEDDDEDYEDVFGKHNGTGEFLVLGMISLIERLVATEHQMQTLQLNTRLSNKSWVWHPFLQVDGC